MKLQSHILPVNGIAAWWTLCLTLLGGATASSPGAGAVLPFFLFRGGPSLSEDESSEVLLSLSEDEESESELELSELEELSATGMQGSDMACSTSQLHT